MSTPAAFHEIQRFRQPWLWGVMAALFAAAAYAFVRQLLLHQPVGDHPMPDAAAWVLLPLLGLGLPLFFAFLRLDVKLDRDTLDLRFVPLRHRRIPLGELASVEATTYRPLRDYGGWGIRLGARGWAYTVSGREGVTLRFKDGRELLVGSQRASALVEALRRHLPA